jgi:hypothetical protein
MKKLKGETFNHMIEKSDSVDKRYLPSFNITGNDLPEIKDWKVGKMYEMKIKVRMKSLNSREEKTSAEFEIDSLEVVKDKKNYEDEYAEKRSGAPR